MYSIHCEIYRYIFAFTLLTFFELVLYIHKYAQFLWLIFMKSERWRNLLKELILTLLRHMPGKINELRPISKNLKIRCNYIMVKIFLMCTKTSYCWFLVKKACRAMKRNFLLKSCEFTQAALFKSTTIFAHIFSHWKKVLDIGRVCSCGR